MGDQPASGLLMLVCPATGEEISTGALYTREDLVRTSRAKLQLYCPFCGETHLFNFSEARLRTVPARSRRNPPSDS